MTKSLASVAALSLLITPVLAMTATASETDANGDGLITIEEVQAVYPDVTAEAFSAMDIDGDGALDADEMQAAQTSGQLPTDG
ncbi:hypothetical protein [Marimonas arenosa]|uniref:EF-hand domain-containing protein n=1 Tax=Marimonas arenosa TaxID=1795305 RepID=A0AAE3WAA0_9RHOB|nr:hypothetical protein [Marimonas arenosa]MDQ2088830.1 hypothetical protein [Marimonas arenosa]